MKVKPITFNADMVRALLDGRKTQTRRPVKGVRNDNRIKVGKHLVSHVMDAAKWCPLGQAGDLLYVRETWGTLCGLDMGCKPKGCASKDPRSHVVYRVDAEKDVNYVSHYRPSIHMPRWASRLTLRITDVRVERVQDISEEDALSEGTDYNLIPNNGLDPMRARTWFRGLWDSIYNNWNDNPWVWVIEFEVIHKNVNELPEEKAA